MRFHNICVPQPNLLTNARDAFLFPPDELIGDAKRTDESLEKHKFPQDVNEIKQKTWLHGGVDDDSLCAILCRCTKVLDISPDAQRYCPSGYSGYFDYKAEADFSRQVLFALPKVFPNLQGIFTDSMRVHVEDLIAFTKTPNLTQLGCVLSAAAFCFRYVLNHVFLRKFLCRGRRLQRAQIQWRR